MWNISTSILRTKHPDFFSRQNVKPSQPRGVCDCRRRFCFARNMKSPPEIRGMKRGYVNRFSRFTEGNQLLWVAV